MWVYIPLLNIYCPGTLHLAVVDIRHGRHDGGGQSLLGGGNIDEVALVVETSDRGHHRGGAGAEHFEEPPLSKGGHHLAHGDLSLRDGEVGPGAAQLYDGPPSDPGQDGALVQGRCHQLLASVASSEEDEEVHGSDLCDLVVITKEPETLLAAVLLCNLNSADTLRLSA